MDAKALAEFVSQLHQIIILDESMFKKLYLNEWQPPVVSSRYRAIIVAPTYSWGIARMHDLNYADEEFLIVPWGVDVQSRFHGMRPDDEGDPVVYLAIPLERYSTDVLVHRDLIWYLQTHGFDVIDLEKIGQNG